MRSELIQRLYPVLKGKNLNASSNLIESFGQLHYPKHHVVHSIAGLAANQKEKEKQQRNILTSSSWGLVAGSNLRHYESPIAPSW